MTSSHLYRNAVILGLLSAIGPFAIDMYLPALPSIGKGLHADPAGVQMSLTAFFISLAFGQLVYGPIADMVGRKPPLYAGLALFTLGSIGCALAPDITTLIGFRFLEGFGACAGMVMPLAIARDLHTGAEAARLMSLVALVFSVSPILAPLTGSIVIAWASWRVVFWIVAGVAILGILMIAAFLPETRAAGTRIEAGAVTALRGYGLLLCDLRFVGTALIAAASTASFFAYLAVSSFVMIGHYHLTPGEYGAAFSVNAASLIGASQFNAMLIRRFGMRPVVRRAVTGYAATMTLLLVLTLAGWDQLGLLIGLLLLGFGFLGLVGPTVSVLALEPHGPISGTASALLGTIQFVVGAVVMALVGLFPTTSSLPMVATIAVCSWIALLLARVTLRQGGPSENLRAPVSAVEAET